MAQRYGGAYSPDAAPDTPPPAQGNGQAFKRVKRSKIGMRSNLLFFAPLPLAIRAFGDGATVMATKLSAFGLLILAAWLTREGIRAHEAYDARRIARRPAIPRKMFGSFLTGLGLAVASTASTFDPLSAAIYFVAGTVLHSLAFGFDPLTNKSAEGVDTYQTDRVARAVEEAEKHLASMAEAAAMTRDRQLEARVAGFAGTARDLFRTVENDPRDLTSVRKYLGVYLLGARDATIKYAELHDRAPTDAARHDFMTLLDDLERNFASRTQKLLTNDKEDLDIEIGVLRDRLAREGVRDIE